MIRRDGDADRRANVDAVRAQFERFGDGQDHAPRDAFDLGHRFDFGEEHGEFVAGEPGEQRAITSPPRASWPDHYPQAIRYHDQQLIPPRLTLTVLSHP